jgi:NADH:ubiquinone oxidoreductase subunit 5 (subunit L)/multisubunit Na+/H+ antiporter MnhA subunit
LIQNIFIYQKVKKKYMYLLLLFFHIFVILITFIIINNFSKKIIIGLIFGSLLFSTLISIFLVYEVVYLNSFCYIELGSWFTVGSLNLNWTFYFDKLTVLMVFLILMISFLVHCFAYDYLRFDPHLIRFLILLSIFTIFMEILVTAGTTVQLFLGWEGVGLMSYLLINFWFTRYYAANSGLMAIIYNRIGDVGVLLAISILFLFTGTSNFIGLILMTKVICLMQFKVLFFYVSVIDLVTFLLFLGTIGKSAQIFLESWLSQAMEGPTPVSSLLHASTMIVSGAFLLQRFQFYIIHSFYGMCIITVIGGLTALFAGTVV